MCHQSVGLLQREIESRGIRTASVMHLPNLAQRIRPPRIYCVEAPLGETFSKPYDIKYHREILMGAIEFAATGGPEEIMAAPFRWDDQRKGPVPTDQPDHVAKVVMQEPS